MVTFALFGLGLLLEIIGFLVAQSGMLPRVRGLLGGKLLAQEEAINRMDHGVEIRAGDTGFSELVAMIQLDIKSDMPQLKNPDYPMVGNADSGVNLLHPRFASVDAPMGVQQPETLKRVRVVFEDGGKTEVMFSALKGQVRHASARKAFIVAAVLFSLGVALQIVGFVNELLAA